MMLCGCCLGGCCRVDGGMLMVLWWCCIDAVVFTVLCRWWCLDAVVMMLCRWWCVDGVVGWVCVVDSVLMVICRWCSDDGIVLMVMCRWCCDDEDGQKEEEEEAGGIGRIVQEKTKTSQSDGGKNCCLILLWQLHPLTLHKTLCYAVMFRKQCHDVTKSEKRGAIPPTTLPFVPLLALKCCSRWFARMYAGRLQNDYYGTWELEYHGALLLSCSQTANWSFYSLQKNDAQKVVPHILSVDSSPCPTSYSPLLFGFNLLLFSFSLTFHLGLAEGCATRSLLIGATETPVLH